MARTQKEIAEDKRIRTEEKENDRERRSVETKEEAEARLGRDETKEEAALRVQRTRDERERRPGAKRTGKLHGVFVGNMPKFTSGNMAECEAMKSSLERDVRHSGGDTSQAEHAVTIQTI